MHEGTSKLQQAHRTVLETEQIGISILGDLQSQRETIMHATGTLQRANESLARSKRTLSAIGRRALANKAILWLLIVLLLLPAAWTVLQLTKHKLLLGEGEVPAQFVWQWIFGLFLRIGMHACVACVRARLDRLSGASCASVAFSNLSSQPNRHRASTAPSTLHRASTAPSNHIVRWREGSPPRRGCDLGHHRRD